MLANVTDYSAQHLQPKNDHWKHWFYLHVITVSKNNENLRVSVAQEWRYRWFWLFHLIMYAKSAERWTTITTSEPNLAVSFLVMRWENMSILYLMYFYYEKLLIRLILPEKLHASCFIYNTKTIIQDTDEQWKRQNNTSAGAIKPTVKEW